MKVALVCANEESLGVEYLSAYLKSHGHETCLLFDPFLLSGNVLNVPFAASVCDYTDYLADRCREESPDLLAFSVITDQYGWALELAARLKRQFNLPVVFGGIHPTSVPQYVIRHEPVDFVITGEGEEALLELTWGLETGRVDASMPNLWTTWNGKPVGNPPRDLIKDLDSLPFPDKDLFYREVRGVSSYTVIVSRGCLNACSYCHHSILHRLYEGRGQYFRCRSVQNVIDELRTAKLYGMRGVTFDDSSFIFDMDWLREFAPLYAEQVGLPCFCWVYPSSITCESVDLLCLMNCQCVNMGVQTMNERTRRNYLHRFYSNDLVAQSISLLRQREILVLVDQIWGLPGEGIEDYTESLYFYSYHRPDKIFIFYLRHYPELEINQQAGFSETKLEAIRQEIASRPFSLDGDYGTAELRRLQCVTLLLHFLPGYVVRLVLRWRLYRLLPAVNPTGLSVLSTLFKGILMGKWRICSVISRRPLKHVHALRKLVTFKIRQGLTRTDY